MILCFKEGDIKKYQIVVEPKDTAAFESGEVHPVYATFALGRDAEWCCRLFVLDMKEPHEEGIGTFLSINHKSPALVGSVVDFTATVETIKGNEIICSYKAEVKGRLIAEGKQGQKIVNKEKLNNLFNSLKEN
ncbi:MAG: thioesterase family protein [Bacteroidia bacterium]